MGNRVKGRPKKKSIKVALHSRVGSKRKLSRMGKKKGKNLSAVDAVFIGRSATLKKLQVSIKDFRRLCILKGIYPREPRRAPRKKKNQVFYHLQDIKALSHEPLLQKFREFKTFMKKVRKASGKKSSEEAQRKMKYLAPEYTIHHLVKERYPRMRDAIADLDDALTLTYLFAALPSDGKVKTKVTNKAKQLAASWGAYCATTSSIDKSFISVKGVYVEAKIPNFQDIAVRWIIPHSFTQNLPQDVDYRVMVTFFEFYETLLDFILFKLYSDLGMRYPLVGTDKALGAAHLCELNNKARFESVSMTVSAAVNAAADQNSKAVAKTDSEANQKDIEKSIGTALSQLPVEDDEDSEDEQSNDGELDEDKLKDALETNTKFEKESEQLIDNEVSIRKRLFSGLTFFLSREVPRGYLELICLSYGARVGWEGDDSPITANDPTITHFIVDRPKLPASFNSYPKSREYIQPQWVFDCSNFRFLLPVKKYSIGSSLPPHLSPWVNNEEEGYKPVYAEQIERMKNGEALSASEDEAMDEDSPDEAEKAADSKDLAASEDEGEDSDDDSDESDEEKEISPEKVQKKLKAQDDEAKELAKLMMSKKAKRLYGRMQHGIAAKKATADLLHKKRKEIEHSKEKSKDGKSVDKQKFDRLKQERRDLEKQYDQSGGSMKKKKRRK